MLKWFQRGGAGGWKNNELFQLQGQKWPWEFCKLGTRILPRTLSVLLIRVEEQRVFPGIHNSISPVFSLRSLCHLDGITNLPRSRGCSARPWGCSTRINVEQGSVLPCFPPPISSPSQLRGSWAALQFGLAWLQHSWVFESGASREELFLQRVCSSPCLPPESEAWLFPCLPFKGFGMKRFSKISLPFAVGRICLLPLRSEGWSLSGALHKYKIQQWLLRIQRLGGADGSFSCAFWGCVWGFCSSGHFPGEFGFLLSKSCTEIFAWVQQPRHCSVAGETWNAV